MAFKSRILSHCCPVKVCKGEKKEAVKPLFLGIFSLPQQKMPMSKGTFFTGQPIFNQILNFIPRGIVNEIARDLRADYYCKSFKTYEHLVTMLYATLNQCTSIREVTTGLLAWDHRIYNLGIQTNTRRSTYSDANKRRSHEVFEKIYFKLLQRYQSLLPDSQKGRRKKNLYIFDSTTITLFQEILKAAGQSKTDGRRKGGIKVHTLLRSDQDVPCMIRYSAGAANDIQFLKQIYLPRGSVIVFDKGYRDYSTYNRFTKQGISWITRHKDNSIYRVIKKYPLSEQHKKQGIQKDLYIELGHNYSKRATKVLARMIHYRDPVTKKKFIFISNNLQFAATTICGYYQKRWQIEVFFKRIKQNYPLKYFLGDNDNAIKIQIWCALIADLLIKIIKHGSRSSLSFSNVVSLVRLHLMTYMELNKFLRSPEKSLLGKVRQQKQHYLNRSLFSP
jgi:transposase